MCVLLSSPGSWPKGSHHAELSLPGYVSTAWDLVAAKSESPKSGGDQSRPWAAIREEGTFRGKWYRGKGGTLALSP